ncbi:hypothetical protein ACMXYX_17890 (plasmid) [Neptuniibacter sp. QD72_48]|uniref:hypothetical protein n=1 Tax=Neptuniibacter sp. QD72_48 TaxID=3398214 RepID=UPI0039F48A24
MTEQTLHVYFNDCYAGVYTRCDQGGYRFTYDLNYMKSGFGDIGVGHPSQARSFYEPEQFVCFMNLINESARPDDFWDLMWTHGESVFPEGYEFLKEKRPEKTSKYSHTHQRDI